MHQAFQAVGHPNALKVLSGGAAQQCTDPQYIALITHHIYLLALVVDLVMSSNAILCTFCRQVRELYLCVVYIILFHVLHLRGCIGMACFEIYTEAHISMYALSLSDISSTHCNIFTLHFTDIAPKEHNIGYAWIICMISAQELRLHRVCTFGKRT